MTAESSPHLGWPEGFTSAAAFTFDFDAEEGWLADGTEPSDLVALSQGSFGAKVAVPQILELLRAHDVAATFFVPGRVAERYPERLDQILEAGHEVAHHGYSHAKPRMLSPDEEETELVKGRRALEAVGAEVIGYRAPSWAPSDHTLSLLERHGFAYSSTFMDDLRPYRHEGTNVVEIPVHWSLDDAAHLWFDSETWQRRISTNSEVREIWEHELLGISRLGGVTVLTLHPQLIGRPGRLRLLDDFMGFVLGHEGVWVATCREIARVD